jgi:hypothetical protein
MNSENYSDFESEKSPFYLKSINGSVVALSDDMHVSPPAFIPVEETFNQHSTLPRITNEDVNTVNINRPPKVPFLTNIYIGSLTVVGLFILFRFIQKHP